MKIIVACGSGVATSTLIASKVEDILKKHDLKAQVIQCSLNEVDGYLKNATLVVTSMGKLKVNSDVPVIVALNYITGIGAEETDAAIEHILLENKDK
jgi:PTS system galactitol-specific IIB component